VAGAGFFWPRISCGVNFFGCVVILVVGRFFVRSGCLSRWDPDWYSTFWILVGDVKFFLVFVWGCVVGSILVW